MKFKINPDKICEERENEGKPGEAFLDEEGRTTKIEYKDDGVRTDIFYEYPRKGIVLEKIAINGNPRFITIENEKGMVVEIDYNSQTISTQIYTGKDKIDLTNDDMEVDVYDSITTTYDRKLYDKDYANQVIIDSINSKNETSENNNLELPIDFNFVPYDLLLKGKHPDARFYEQRVALDIGKNGKIFKRTDAVRKKTDSDGKVHYFTKKADKPTKEVKSISPNSRGYGIVSSKKAELHGLICSRETSKLRQVLDKFLNFFKSKDNHSQEK